MPNIPKLNKQRGHVDRGEATIAEHPQVEHRGPSPQLPADEGHQQHGADHEGGEHARTRPAAGVAAHEAEHDAQESAADE